MSAGHGGAESWGDRAVPCGDWACVICVGELPPQHFLQAGRIVGGAHTLTYPRTDGSPCCIAKQRTARWLQIAPPAGAALFLHAMQRRSGSAVQPECRRDAKGIRERQSRALSLVLSG